MKSNTIYNIIRYKAGAVLVSALALFSACSDDLTSGGDINSGKPLDLQANIQQENVTRANDNGFADGDQIGVFVVNYENETTAPILQLSGNHADNVRFTYDDN